MIFNLLFRLMSAFKLETFLPRLFTSVASILFTVIRKGKVVPGHVMKGWTEDLQLHSF